MNTLRIKHDVEGGLQALGAGTVTSVSPWPLHARIFHFHGTEMLLALLHKTENILQTTFRIDGLTKASCWLPILYFSIQ